MLIWKKINQQSLSILGNNFISTTNTNSFLLFLLNILMQENINKINIPTRTVWRTWTKRTGDIVTTLPAARTRLRCTKKAGFWYFLICNTFRLLVWGVCHSKKGGFRFAAWTRPCGSMRAPHRFVARANLGIELRSGKGVRAFPPSYPYPLYDSRVRTYKSTSIALSAALSHQNIKGSDAYRCTRFL
jgi:hypothetical protein